MSKQEVKQVEDTFYPMFQKQLLEIRQLKDALSAAGDRERKLLDALTNVISKCKGSEAYTDAAWAHYYAYSALQEVYGNATSKDTLGMDQVSRGNVERS